MKSAVVIQPWVTGESDLAALRSIRSESRGQPVPAEWLQAKYGNPATPVVAALALQDGVAKGIVSFGINPYIAADSQLRVAVSYDTYVSPDVRGRGVFTELRRSAEALAIEFNIDMFLNAPNAQSRRGFESGGWQPLGALRGYVRPLRPQIAKVPRRVRELAGMRGHQLIPVEGVETSSSALVSFAECPEQASEFRMYLDVDQTCTRFHPDRGGAYGVVRAESAAAIVRVGLRGGLLEVQLMALAPRRPTSHSLRSLVRVIRSIYEPDIVSFVAAATPSVSRTAVLAGFVPAGISTTFYTKGSDPRITATHLLSGADVHTW